ncbi:MAG: hypothetical protein RBU37_07950 [Myxococcota bacterium]|jgi:hypothetical protein|nr:hypothetical protein [Myxococcota bacterium]
MRQCLGVVSFAALLLFAFGAEAVEPFNPTEKEPSSKVFMFSLGTGMSPIESLLSVTPVSVNSRLGFFVHPKVLIDFGIDFAHIGASSESEYESPFGSEKEESSDGTSLLTFHLGGKIFFGKIKRSDVVFYDQTSLIVTIPLSHGDDDEGLIDETSDSFGIGFLQGLGAEYFFAESFSVGGELGLNGAFWLTSKSEDDGEYKSSSDSVLKLIDVYTAFTLNFYI